MFYNQLFFIVCAVCFCAGDQFEDECGLEATQATPLVRQGRMVRKNEFPWQVAIFEKLDGQFGQVCGGSLVRSKLVITAAHCFSAETINHQVYVDDYRVVGGSLLSSWNAQKPDKQTSRVRAVRLGERYGGINRNFQGDIAVVFLKNEFTFSPVVRAICLDLVDRELHNTQTSPDSVGKVAGWGLTESGVLSDSLVFLSVPVVGDAQCTQRLINTASSYTSYITVDKICAGLTNGSAVYPGDSGAGLVFPLRNRLGYTSPPPWYLRAVLSNVLTSYDRIPVQPTPAGLVLLLRNILGSAVCPGDSGAGLVFPLRNTDTSRPRWYLRGVLSNAPSPYKVGNVCPINAVALYTNVFTHRVWLSSIMEEFQSQEGCKVKGSAGVCREFSQCLAARREAFVGILPQICSPSSTKICCVESVESVESAVSTQLSTESNCPPLPPSTISQRKTGSKANDYCVNLAEKLYPCQQNGSSWSREDLCGPEPEQREPYYWMFPLTRSGPSRIQRYVLAHRVGAIPVHLVSERWLFARATDFDRLLEQAGENITPPEVVFAISKSVRHPQFRLHGIYSHDMVLLETDRPIPISRRYRPVCLHTAQDPLEELALTGNGFRLPAILLFTEECRRLFPGGVNDGVMCVSSNRDGCGYTWNCLMASNGHRVPCTQLLVGLYVGNKREGYTCADRYLRVALYVPWVESVVWP